VVLSDYLYTGTVEAEVIVESAKVAATGDFVDEDVDIELLSTRYSNARVGGAERSGSVARGVRVNADNSERGSLNRIPCSLQEERSRCCYSEKDADC
jgi:hypothetical protein